MDNIFTHWRIQRSRGSGVGFWSSLTPHTARPSCTLLILKNREAKKKIKQKTEEKKKMKIMYNYLIFTFRYVIM